MLCFVDVGLMGFCFWFVGVVDWKVVNLIDVREICIIYMHVLVSLFFLCVFGCVVFETVDESFESFNW